MKKQAQKVHKMNKVVRVLLLPGVVIVLLIGWSMAWVGARCGPKK